MAVKILADASFLVAFFVEDHIYQPKVKVILGKNRVFVVTILSLEETFFVLKRKYGFNRLTLEKVVDSLLSPGVFNFVEIPDQLGLANRLVSASERLGLKSRDALHYLIMKQRGIRLMATFDQDFIKKQKALGIKVSIF